MGGGEEIFLNTEILSRVEQNTEDSTGEPGIGHWEEWQAFPREPSLVILPWEILKYSYFLGTEPFPLIPMHLLSLIPFLTVYSCPSSPSYTQIFSFTFTIQGRAGWGEQEYKCTFLISKEHILSNFCLEDTKNTVH